MCSFVRKFLTRVKKMKAEESEETVEKWLYNNGKRKHYKSIVIPQM